MPINDRDEPIFGWKTDLNNFLKKKSEKIGDLITIIIEIFEGRSMTRSFLDTNPDIIIESDMSKSDDQNPFDYE